MKEIDTIFEGFLKFSNAVQRVERIRILKEEIIDLKSHCGSCELWMRSKCPRESKTKKVSMGESICSHFIMNSRTQKQINEKEFELKNIH